MSSDDQEVEAWYLEGWCFYLMAEQSKESGQKIEDLTWEELAKDARDCLETCKNVRFWFTNALRGYSLTGHVAAFFLAAHWPTASGCTAI